MDDSGSRDLDKTDEQVGSKWFALGGVLVTEEAEVEVRAAHSAFCARWEIDYPLHSYDIRNGVENFAWLAELSAGDRRAFFDD